MQPQREPITSFAGGNIAVDVGDLINNPAMSIN